MGVLGHEIQSYYKHPGNVCIRSAVMVMGVPVVSRLELKPSAVSGLETTAQACYVVYWEPQDLLCVHLLTILSFV